MYTKCFHALRMPVLSVLSIKLCIQFILYIYIDITIWIASQYK